MKRKAEQNNLTERALIKSLACSFCSILFAMVCLVGLTYAWFSARVSGGVTTVTAANFTVKTVAGDPEESLSPNAEGYTLQTEEAAEITVTITAGGGASQGYFQVTLGSYVFFTEPVAPEAMFAFTVDFTQASSLTLTVSPRWGTVPEGKEQIGSNAVFTYDGVSVMVPTSAA